MGRHRGQTCDLEAEVGGTSYLEYQFPLAFG